MEEDLAYVGRRQLWGQEKLFGFSAAVRRHHVYIIGKTGSGKTSLLRNLIVQDIAAGRGVGLIDPHGDLADELLDCVPPWRTDHLVYFNPADRDYPIGFNLIANVPAPERHLVASGVVSAFRNIWGKSSWGPRLEYILYNCVAALCECQNVSLLGVQRMLSDQHYRHWVSPGGLRPPAMGARQAWLPIRVLLSLCIVWSPPQVHREPERPYPGINSVLCQHWVRVRQIATAASSGSCQGL